MIPLWLPALGKGLWKFITAVPWWAWLVLLLAFSWWYDRGAQYDAGVRDENARWVAVQEAANLKAQEDEHKRDKEAAHIDDKAEGRAHEATVETRTETAAAVETIRYEIRTVEVPASCNRPLPGIVRDDLAAAVRAANAAGGELRAGQHP